MGALENRTPKNKFSPTEMKDRNLELKLTLIPEPLSF